MSTDPVTMVESQDKTDKFARVKALALSCVRFNEEPNEQAVDKQIQDKDKWIRKAGLTRFSADSEQALEDWVDQAARVCKRHNLCCELFRQLWAASSEEAIADSILPLSGDKPEKIVSEIAKKLFTHSRHRLDT
eukprot:GHVQ01039001.1.p1 GENE.GHVQ01039001.1~~GHVQ01039001.1.p1  ORF type:complete len:134 (-),score=15.79 GHVQ01039001.1:697-1098(-)